jgi:hypothetical protein
VTNRFADALVATCLGLALAAAACGDATPATTTTAAPTSTATPETSTTPPVDSSTTTPAPATSTTTTTVAPSTNDVIVGFEGVLGWWDGSDWRDLDDGEPPAVEGDLYQVLLLGEEPVEVTGGPVTGGCDFIEGSRAVDVGIEIDTWPQPTPIAVSTTADVMPHPVELLATPPAVYTDIVSELLVARGVVDPDPPLVQVIRTDLEGDGVDEVLIAAERNETGALNPAAVGDYSLLVLRKIVQGQVQTAIIADFIVEEPVVDGSIIALDTLRFTTVADFNDDGKMEIAYTSQYYEGSSTHLVEYVNDDLGPVEVLSVGCGV